MRVVLDLEPRSYRETVELALRHLRPHHEFVGTGSGDVSGEGPASDTRLVMSYRPDPGGTFAWAEVLYGAHEITRLRIGDECRELRGLDLAGLVSILDAVERADEMTKVSRGAEGAVV